MAGRSDAEAKSGPPTEAPRPPLFDDRPRDASRCPPSAYSHSLRVFLFPSCFSPAPCGGRNPTEEGESFWLASWSQDHTLRSALRNSVVWFHQEMGPLDRFWLEGDGVWERWGPPAARGDLLRNLLRDVEDSEPQRPGPRDTRSHGWRVRIGASQNPRILQRATDRSRHTGNVLRMLTG